MAAHVAHTSQSLSECDPTWPRQDGAVLQEWPSCLQVTHAHANRNTKAGNSFVASVASVPAQNFRLTSLGATHMRTSGIATGVPPCFSGESGAGQHVCDGMRSPRSACSLEVHVRAFAWLGQQSRWVYFAFASNELVPTDHGAGSYRKRCVARHTFSASAAATYCKQLVQHDRAVRAS